jgi:integrase
MRDPPCRTRSRGSHREVAAGADHLSERGVGEALPVSLAVVAQPGLVALRRRRAPRLASLVASQTRRCGGSVGQGTAPAAHVPRVGEVGQVRQIDETAVDVVLGAGWSGHSCRHAFASKAYAGTRDLRAVQTLLGHSKPETTARYTAVPDGALAAAVAVVSFAGDA